MLHSKHINVFIWSILLFLRSGMAQPAEVKPDSSLWTFDFQYDQRRAVFMNKNILSSKISSPIHGLVGEFTYKKHWRIGLGFYLSTLNNSNSFLITEPFFVNKIREVVPRAAEIKSNNNNAYLVNSSNTILYFTPCVEYIFFRSKWLDLGLPVEIGLGKSELLLSDFFTKEKLPYVNSDGSIAKNNNFFFPALVGLNPLVHLSKDVVFSASFGYRMSLGNGPVNKYFNGLYYQIGLQLIPDDIRKELKKDFLRWKNQN